jgi:hypothetical protein
VADLAGDASRPLDDRRVAVSAFDRRVGSWRAGVSRTSKSTPTSLTARSSSLATERMVSIRA